MTTAPHENLTRDETRSLHRLASRLEREAETAKRGGLEERAASLTAEARTVRERIQKANEAQQDASLEALRERNRIQERHARQERERQEREAREAAAKEWMKAHQWHGDPVDSVATLRAASEAGHQAPDLLAVCTRVRRLRDGADCLTVHSFLRRDFSPQR